jgi:hypothetical protein
VADIKVTSTGRIFYQVPDVLAALLREAFPESFAKVEPKPAPNVVPSKPGAPRFIARLHPLYGTPEVVRFFLNQEQKYPSPGSGTDSTVEGARAAFAAAGHIVPDECLQHFSALLDAARRNDPDVVNDVRERAKNQQFAQDARERLAQRKLTGE